MTEEEVYKMM